MPVSRREVADFLGPWRSVGASSEEREAMASDLSEFIADSPLCSTHEHTEFEQFYQQSRPDVLAHLFSGYLLADLISAGASPEAVQALRDGAGSDIDVRFKAIEPAWRRVELGGYAEGAKLAAALLFGIEEITADTLRSAQASSTLTGQPGERLRLLKDVANLDHVQIDTGTRPLPREMLGQGFFLYDINMLDACNGTPDLESLALLVGREITSIALLRAALELLFERSAKYAVAVKSQHAYGRSLAWIERSDQEAEAAFASWLRLGNALDDPERICLADWCLARVAELAGQHDLPLKLHTGYYAGNNSMIGPLTAAGNLSRLVRSHPQTRFVLMHIAYPYSNELIAMAKHYRNVAIDMCWAWSINPFHAADFTRRFIHGAPLNKLFVFGGDSLAPAHSVGFALQARRWLDRSLQAEVEEGLISERKAMEVARFLMMDSPRSYFDIERKQDTLKGISEAETTAAVGQGTFAEPRAVRGTLRVLRPPL